MGNYAFFWGCQIPFRFAYMEKSTRLVLPLLGINAVDLDGLTCCPEKSLIKSMDKFVWYLTAARNLALAEKAEKDFLVICNGCSSSLKSAARDLKWNVELNDKVNQCLAKIDLEYKGTAKVKHIVEVLADEISPDVIRKKVVKPLKGMRIGVHYGCHMMRPSDAVMVDDPLNPKKYDRIIEALGAKSVDYHSKLLCCGNALNVADVADAANLAVRTKLNDLKEAQADALSVTCPACFMQFDGKQFIMKRGGEPHEMPVLTLVELIGLALGLSPSELGVANHRVNTDSFFRKWDKRLSELIKVEKTVDMKVLQDCYRCGACVDDCPAAQVCEDFNPQEIVGKMLAGEIEELINDPRIWECLECHTCYEMCPQKFGMEKVITLLKHLAIQRGVMPSPAKAGIDIFMKTGKLGEPSKSQRKKLGLGEFPASGQEELIKLLEEIDE